MIECGVDYFWQSQRDGCFYKVKCVSKDEKLKTFKFRLIELVHLGFVSKPTEKINIVKAVLDNPMVWSAFHTNLDKMLIDYMVEKINSKSETYENKLKMFGELIPLFDNHPDLHYKALEKLSKNPLFNKLIDKKINLKKALEVIKG